MTAIAKVEEGQFKSEPETLEPAATLAELSGPQRRVLFSTIDDGDKKQLFQRLPCHYFDYMAGSSFGGWENCIHRNVTTLINS